MANKAWVLVYYGLSARPTRVTNEMGQTLTGHTRDTMSPFFYQGFYIEDPRDLSWKPAFDPDVTNALQFVSEEAGLRLLPHLQGDFYVEERDIPI